jgi:protein-disulfide isomerase-like protein with CxxC motif
MRVFYKDPEHYTLARKNVRGSRERNYDPQCALGYLIDEAITRQHLNTVQAMRLSGCTSTQLADYKAGRHFPQLPTLIKLCKGLGINFEEAAKAIKESYEEEAEVPT